MSAADMKNLCSEHAAADVRLDENGYLPYPRFGGLPYEYRVRNRTLSADPPDVLPLQAEQGHGRSGASFPRYRRRLASIVLEFDTV